MHYDRNEPPNYQRRWEWHWEAGKQRTITHPLAQQAQIKSSEAYAELISWKIQFDVHFFETITNTYLREPIDSRI